MRRDLAAFVKTPPVSITARQGEDFVLSAEIEIYQRCDVRFGFVIERMQAGFRLGNRSNDESSCAGRFRAGASSGGGASSSACRSRLELTRSASSLFRLIQRRRDKILASIVSDGCPAMESRLRCSASGVPSVSRRPGRLP